MIVLGLHSVHSGHNWVMIIILSIVIVFSLMVIISLGVYICKHKKQNKTQPTLTAASSKPYSDNVLYNLHQLEPNNNNKRSVKNINPLASVASANSYNSFSNPDRSHSTSSSVSSSDIDFTQQTSTTILNPLNPRSGSRRYVKNIKQPRTHPPTISGPIRNQENSHGPIRSQEGTHEPIRNEDRRDGPIRVEDQHSRPIRRQSGHKLVVRSDSVPNINQSGLPKVPPPVAAKPKLKPKPGSLTRGESAKLGPIKHKPVLPKSASTSDLTDAHADLQAELKKAILGSSQQSISRIEWPR